MRFIYGTDIINFSGEKVGELEHVVIDPETNKVTNLIVNKGFLLPNDKVLPISLVMESNEDHIKLYNFEGSFDDFDDYIELHYVKSKSTTVEDYEEGLPLLPYPPSGSYGPTGYVPIYHPSGGMETKVIKNTPTGTKSIKEGAKVFGLKGEHVGDVEEVIIKPQSDEVTHFVISKGMLFTEEKLIPTNWVKGYDSNQLKLVVDSTIVEGLPEYES